MGYGMMGFALQSLLECHFYCNFFRCRLLVFVVTGLGFCLNIFSCLGCSVI